MTTLYYNTTNESKDYVVMRKRKNLSQNEIVLDIFKTYRKLSASEVLERFPTKNTPITSIRRSLNSLMLDCKLIKTDDSRIGLFGAKEKYFELAIKENNQYLMF